MQDVEGLIADPCVEHGPGDMAPEPWSLALATGTNCGKQRWPYLHGLLPALQVNVR